MTAEDDAPWLVAAPGMSVDEVTSRSTVPIDRVDLDEQVILQASWAHCVVVPDPRRGFALPLGLFSVVEARAGRVVRVRATPTPEALPWGAALALVGSLGASLDAARWIPAEAPRGDALARRFEGRDDGVAARWRNSPWALDLTLQRVARAGTGLARCLAYTDDAWLVTATVADRRFSY